MHGTVNLKEIKSMLPSFAPEEVADRILSMLLLLLAQFHTSERTLIDKLIDGVDVKSNVS
jgi:hypothetical protein